MSSTFRAVTLPARPPLIRPVVDADLDAIVAINAANVPAVGPADSAHLARLVDEAALSLAVVDTETHTGTGTGGDTGTSEAVIGFCIVFAPGAGYDSVNYRWFMERYDDAMYLDRVAFDHRRQGLGLGRALYADVFGRLQRDHAGMRRLTLEVNVDPPNEQSLRFHARHGFVEVGRQMSKGIEVSLMERAISPVAD